MGDDRIVNGITEIGASDGDNSQKFSLSVDGNNRILSATYGWANPNGIIVDELPEGNITDYIVVVNGEGISYTYDPLPVEAPTATWQDTIESQVFYTAMMTNTLIEGEQ